MAAVSDLIQATADWLFMPWIVAILLGSGLFLTLRYRFVQVTRFAEPMAART